MKQDSHILVEGMGKRADLLASNSKTRLEIRVEPRWQREQVIKLEYEQHLAKCLTVAIGAKGTNFNPATR